MQPAAERVELITSHPAVVPLGGALDMTRRHAHGLFETQLPWSGETADLEYRLRVHDHGGVREFADPYRFGQVLTDFDIHLLSEGTHYRAWEKLGASHLSLNTMKAGLKTPADHIDAIRRFKEATAAR